MSKHSDEKPYIEKTKIEIIHIYNPNYGDDRVCECGHTYYRHFDWMEDEPMCCCKYCGCWEFKEKKG